MRTVRRGMVSGDRGALVRSKNSGQFGGGDPGDIGGGDPGDIGGGDPGDIGGGDPGDIGGGDPGDIGGGTGQGKPASSARSYSPSPAPPGGVGPVVIDQGRINFRIQLQEQSEWCWAAVATSIEKYFNRASTLEQCNVVNRVLQPSSDDLPGNGCTGGCDDCKCCCDPDSDICNTPAPLEEALQKIHKWRATLPRPLRFDEIQREIDRGRPIGAGITWASGNSAAYGRISDPTPKGHFVVIRGYRVLSSGARQLDVADPLNASGLVDFDEFTLAYYGDGAWTETDLVRSGLA
jgi:hypothetical protein